MTISSIDEKAVREFIIANRDIGKADHEIFKELIEKYPSKTRIEKMRIENLISKTVTNNLKKKYKTFNVILLVLIGIKILTLLLAIINLLLKNNFNESFFWFSIFIIINVYLFDRIAKYKGSIYGTAMTISIFFFTYNILEKHYDLINLIIEAFIIVLSIYLGNKLFPKFRYTE
jgi:hypothetical protein